MKQLPPLNIWLKAWCIFLMAAAFWLGSYAYWQHRFFDAIHLTLMGFGAWAFWKRTAVGRLIMLVLLTFGIISSLVALLSSWNVLFIMTLPITTFILYKIYKFKPQPQQSESTPNKSLQPTPPAPLQASALQSLKSIFEKQKINRL